MSNIKRLFSHIISNRAENSPIKILGKSWLELADEFHLNQDSPKEKRGKIVKDRWGSYKKSQTYRDSISERATTPAVEEMFEKDESDDTMTTVSKTEHLYTKEQHVAFFKIDTKVWEVDRQITNAWGQKSDVLLKQRKIWWRRKEEKLVDLKKSLTSLIKIPAYKPKKLKRKGSLCVELMITDLHLGKVGFNPDTMEFNWTLKEAGQAYSDAIDYLVSQVDPSEISEFLLPTGNDMLNIDNSNNETTRGTPQMAGVFWETMFRYSHQLVGAAIDKLSKIAPVFVPMVSGNHDENSVFSLGEVLKARFSENPNVTIINKPIKRPYHKFGDCMIGYTHGQGLTFKNAGKAPAIDEPEMYGKTKFRAMHMGHLHTRRVKRTMELDSMEEFDGVDIEICPSLSPVDRWHYKQFYSASLRRTKSFVWHKTKGLVGEFYWGL